MNKPNFTTEQSLAIESRETSVALSAGAGCGKTFVLTERFLSHLEPDASPRAELSQLVAITFTERAAREMRDRVRQKCHERLLNANASESHYWLNLLRDLDTARVSTIHSFCTALLRSNAVEAGLDPRFGVLEQTASETLLAELVDDLLRSKLAQQDEPTLSLASVHGLQKLKSMLQGLVSRSNESDLDKWQETSAEELVALWDTFRREQVLPALLRQLADSESAKQILSVLRSSQAINEKMKDRQAVLLERLPDLANSNDPKEDLAAILDAARVQGAGKNPFDDQQAYDQFKAAAETLRKEIKKCLTPFEFNSEQALPAAAAGLELLSLARDLDNRFALSKQELRVLDFNDLIRKASQLLSAPEHDALRKRVSSQIQLVMVDEFQDTSPAQVTLVRALCGEELQTGKLFFVGDLKQSIYRFRGANPGVVHSLRQDIPEAGRLPLSKNFRSQPAILNFVNETFAPAFGEAYEPLVSHRPQVTPEPAIEFLWASAEEEDRASGARQRARKREADWIARRIRAMLDQGESLVAVSEKDSSPDNSTTHEPTASTRPVRPGDIVILFRALSDVQLYEEALRRYELDYYLVGGHAFYAQQEIFDLLNLLRAIANPADEVSLVGALRSPFFSLTDETLFWLAREAASSTQDHEFSAKLDAALATASTHPDLDPAQRELAQAAAETLGELRSLKDRLPVAELIQLALDRTGYDAVLLAEFLGERKLANLQKLVDQARTFDASGLFSLGDFLVQLSQFIVKQPHEPLAATQPETTDVIRLMTIHQAKGLEFPVVVVADLERTGAHQSGDVALSDELGPLTRWRNEEGKSVFTGFDLFQLVEREQEEQESTRLFYVACTRAADYLILASSIQPKRWPESNWTKILARRFHLNRGVLLDSSDDGFSDDGPFDEGSSDDGPSDSGRPDAPSDPPSDPQSDSQDALARVTLSEPQLAPSKENATASRVKIEKALDQATQLASTGKYVPPISTAPIAPDPSDRRQFSFSRLTGKLHSTHTSLAEPDSHSGNSPSESLADLTTEEQSPNPTDARQFGSLVHAILEHLPLGSVGDSTSSVAANELRELVERIAPRHSLEPGAETELAINLVERFLESPQARELAEAKSVHREIEFLLAWPPGQANNSTASLPPRYIQGYLDCLYQGADGGWRILDYKTNNIAASQIPETAAQYETQMRLYALAAEEILGEAPRELILYFLRLDHPERIAWNDNARAEVLRDIDQAIES